MFSSTGCAKALRGGEVPRARCGKGERACRSGDESKGAEALWARNASGRPGPGRTFGFFARFRCNFLRALVSVTNLFSWAGVDVLRPAAECE